MASKSNHQACAKQHTNTQLMRILISRMFTQDMTTWKHAANEIHNLCATQHKTRGQESARSSGLETVRSHNKTEHGARVSKLRHELKLKTWVPGSDTMLQHKTRHADERAHGSSTLEDVHSHKNRTWRECQGSVIKPMNDTRPKRQRQETMIERVLRINTLLNVNSCQSIVFSCCVTFLHYFDLRANREDMLLLFVISRGLLCLL